MDKSGYPMPTVEPASRDSAAAAQDFGLASRLGHRFRTSKSLLSECLAALDGIYRLLTVDNHKLARLQRERLLLQSQLLNVKKQLEESQAGEKRARYLALHDELTSLPNRSFFRQRLTAAFNGNADVASTVSVIYLDLDGFKALNDEHGHWVGDELLKCVAGRLWRTVRAEDMLSRLGGDEFACLVYGLSRAQLLILANKLYEVVSAPCQIGNTPIVVRPSIGIAMTPIHGADADSILKSADSAMYVAKRRRTAASLVEDDGFGAVAFSTREQRP